MLRAAVKEGTELGQRADSIMKAGAWCPDDVMIGIVEYRLGRPDAMTRGYLLDGFPRTAAQAEALDDITGEEPARSGHRPSMCPGVVLERLSSRRGCRDCGTNYHSTGMERRPWICEVCSGDVIHRGDRHEDAINRRLDGYETQTRPSSTSYATQGLLVG
jgi:adenylate kinase